MIPTSLSKLALEILGFLHTLDNPQQLAAVAGALAYPEPLVASALKMLCEEGRVARIPDGETAPADETDYRYMIFSERTSPPSASESSALWGTCTRLLERILRSARQLDDDARQEKDELFRTLTLLRASLTDAESRNVYMRVLLQLLSAGVYMPKLGTRTVPLVEWLLQREGSEALDAPSQARLRAALTIFRYQTCPFFDTAEEFVPSPPETFCPAGVEPDSFCLLLSGCLYYINGEVGRVLELHERYSLRPLDDSPLWHDLFSMNVSQAALHSRRFPLSRGIIESFRNMAEITGSSRQSLVWRLHLTFLLLHMNRLDEALAHIDQLISSTQGLDFRAFSDVASRSLALYHFKHGRLKTAARILAENAEQARSRHAVVHPITDPDVLEMLYELEKQRGKPILGYEVETEIQRWENSPNRLLRGVGMRLRGLIYRDQHKDDLALNALQRSFQALLQSGNSTECLRSGVELERALLEAEQHADYLHLKDRLVRLSAEISSERSTDASRDGSVAGVRRCLAAFADMPAGDDSGENLSRLTAVIRRELSAQRVLLLRNTPYGGFEYAAASNLTPVELHGDKLKAVVHRLRTLCGRASPEQPLLWQQHAQDADTAVGLAVYVSTRAPWLLYMDNSLGTGDFANLSPDMACLFSTAVAAEIRGSLRGQGRTMPRTAPVRESREMFPVFGEGLHHVLEDADRAAEVNASVLILGETGVGKELLARRIYERSGCSGPFVSVHLACVSEHLFESELFGHEKGSFTGAIRAKTGLVELAQQGVLFLDEVGDMPMSFQIKLLRFLQEREFMRVGGIQRIRADFRLITATNRDLREEVRQGRFREDLYYRLAVIPLRLPALRERRDDIPVLAAAFRAHFAEQHHRSPAFPTDAQLLAFRDLPWPGNIRQLQNVIERAVVLERLEFEAPPPPEPCAAIPPRTLTVPPAPPGAPSAPPPLPSDVEALLEGYPTAEALQRAYICRVLEHTNGKIYGKDGAAAILGMTKSTIYNRIKTLRQDDAAPSSMRFCSRGDDIK